MPGSTPPPSARGLTVGEEHRPVRNRCGTRLLQGQQRIRVGGGRGGSVSQNPAERARAQGRSEAVDVQVIGEW